MIILWGDVVTVAGLGLIVLRKGRDRFIGSNGLANWLLIAGLVALGLQATVHLILASGEAPGGDLGGAGHLVSAFTVVIFGLFALSRPREVGAGTLTLGALILLCYGPGALFVSLPLLFSGLVLVVSAVLARGVTGRLPIQAFTAEQTLVREYHE